LLNIGCIDGGRSLNRSRILKFENISDLDSRFKFFGKGAKSEFENVTPATFAMCYKLWTNFNIAIISNA